MKTRHVAFLAGALWMAAIDRFFVPFQPDERPLAFSLLVLGGLFFLKAMAMDKEARR
jgi:hypothetical protein